MPQLLVLIDENVPDSVASVFREHGHDVRLVREHLASGAPDALVAAAADRIGAIVVTWNRKDFKRLAAPLSDDGHQRFRKLSWIIFKCAENLGAQRARALMGDIENVFVLSQTSSSQRLRMVISTQSYQVYR